MAETMVIDGFYKKINEQNEAQHYKFKDTALTERVGGIEEDMAKHLDVYSKHEKSFNDHVDEFETDVHSVAFQVTVTDDDALLAFANGQLKAVLYDGEKLVEECDLSLGVNSVSFDKLKRNTCYQYAIVGFYDDFSGTGAKWNVIFKDVFTTDAIVLFDAIEVTQNGILFDLGNRFDLLVVVLFVVFDNPQ